MNTAQPLAQCFLRVGLGWRALQLFLQILGAYVARIELGKYIKKVLHVGFLFVAWSIGIVSSHGVQESPGLRTQFVLIQRAILSTVVVIVNQPLILFLLCLLRKIFLKQE